MKKDIKPVTATEWSQPNATILILTPFKHSTLVAEETTLEAPADIPQSYELSSSFSVVTKQ